MTAQARLLGGRYQVGELLGYGGMAEVHHGRDLRLGRDVAIKMLRTDLARDATFQMRFRREAQNAASLNHPAIVAVYDTGEEIAATGETIPFIVMEFVNGRTLKEVLAAEGRLMPRRALELTADMCAALEFSHRHGIIHRDIKPGNVMLTQNGAVKVMDFGIARALASGATTMTQTSAVIGTAQYLSPEQARGEAVDARSDVYAAGCVLFELMCSHPPFVGDSPVSVAYQHVREDPRAPSEINPEVTPAIDAIVLKALSKNPLNRYQSAGEMRADLLRAANGRPVMATPVMREDETMAMAPSATTRQAGGGPAPARVGDPRRRKASAWVLAALSALGVLAVIALIAGLIAAGNDEPDLVTVPGVVDKPVAAATAELEGANLKVVSNVIKQDDCVLNNVLTQAPAAGERIEPGQEVTLQVCGGAELVTIPDLAGYNKTGAQKALEDAKLVPEWKPVDSSQSKDQVVKVPDAGKDVEPGTKVVVELSNGLLRSVPNVVGMGQSEATTTLRNADFEVTVREGQESDDPGRVTAQNPGANQEAKRGTTITITVTQPRAEPTESPTPTPTTPTPTPSDGGGGGDGGGAGVIPSLPPFNGRGNN
ncbi:Stk1 family PASTA domain-containing Ser/Thr kinase [Polymorphospora sp. NPDC051019]|uniref:Stk1 family PASTA domain-containing Ser/Thr kinase n=1 Tax=Polymorphospora sp. NPDC051019 TaxID=3155725 RepID=UPI00341D0BB3